MIALWFFANYSYDDYGRIESLQRNGQINQSTNPTPVFGTLDQLDYIYDNVGQLEIVNETGNVSRGYKNGGTYDYENGNLIKDDAKGISLIEYNFLNKPTKIVSTNEEITIFYDADGNVMRKVLSFNGKTTTIEYIGNVAYINNIRKSIYHEHGRVAYNSSLTGMDENHYLEYNIKDHLGSVRVSFVDKNHDGKLDYDATDNSNHEIVASNHFYPHGMKIEGTSSSQGAINPFQYNGMESMEGSELNIGYTHYRVHDPSLGMWWQVDPLAEMGVNHTPYNANWNNPISYADPMGDIPFNFADAFFGGAIAVLATGIVLGNTGLADDMTTNELWFAAGSAFATGFMIGGGLQPGPVAATISNRAIKTNGGKGGVQSLNFNGELAGPSIKLVSMHENSLLQKFPKIQLKCNNVESEILIGLRNYKIKKYEFTEGPSRRSDGLYYSDVDLEQLTPELVTSEIFNIDGYEKNFRRGVPYYGWARSGGKYISKDYDSNSKFDYITLLLDDKQASRIVFIKHEENFFTIDLVGEDPFGSGSQPVNILHIRINDESLYNEWKLYITTGN